MADPTTARPTRVHQGLPEEIVIWEILVRLPPKALLRCRAVCSAWRRATSIRDFLIAHHGRQPTLPLAFEPNYRGIYCGDIITIDNQAADAQVQHVARVRFEDKVRLDLDASCDGLLLFTDTTKACFSICNPTTREHARLSMLSSFVPLGMYRHLPTGEYRILMYHRTYDPANVGFYIFALGSVQLPRKIGWSTVVGIFYGEAILLHGSLHWHVEKHECGSNIIMVFNTIAESSCEMCAPVVPDRANLFEIYGMLGMSNFSDDEVEIIDIWMMQDYLSEVWTLNYRVELPVSYLNVQFGQIVHDWHVVVHSCDGDMLVLVRFGEWLLHFDIEGSLVAYFHHVGLRISQHRLKQTLVPHTFFPTLDGYSVNRQCF
uniref:Uncharacterized protein n=1 Tax=Aegilops tauschii TaxID=37682 RepID=N1R3E7_AEGTA